MDNGGIFSRRTAMLHSQLGRITLAIEMIKMQVPPGWSPEVGVILGSGLGALADEVQAVASLPYASVPGFVKSSVEGHAGRLVLGTLEKTRVVLMQGDRKGVV